MTKLEIHREDRAGRTTLRLEGTLDGRTAQALSRTLAQVPQGDVVVDFTHLREFRDTAVPVLWRELRPGVQLRGLVEHQERLLRYFGVGDAQAQVRRADSARS